MPEFQFLIVRFVLLSFLRHRASIPTSATSNAKGKVDRLNIFGQILSTKFRFRRCGKGFMDKQKLQIHTRIHTGETRKTFAWTSLTKSFSGERPHACHICPHTFIHQTDLRRHIWGHVSWFLLTESWQSFSANILNIFYAKSHQHKILFRSSLRQVNDLTSAATTTAARASWNALNSSITASAVIRPLPSRSRFRIITTQCNLVCLQAASVNSTQFASPTLWINHRDTCD